MSAPLPRRSKAGNAPDMEVEPSVLAQPDPSDADSLISSNDPDDLANEQTWPTEEEMANDVTAETIQGGLPDAQTGTTPKVVKRIPKGMSEYQAAWIIDEDDEDDEVDKEGNSEAEMDEVEDEEMVDLPMNGDGEDVDLESRKGVTFQDLDVEEEEKQYVLNFERDRNYKTFLQVGDLA